MPGKQTSAATSAAGQEPRSLAALNRLIMSSAPFVEGSRNAVLGEGPLRPDVAFVGEQPGDQEDHEGRPFVGPAGKLLDRALEDAGMERSAVYITNAVKHFKFLPRGKRRIHQSPTVGEIKHYRWWLRRELDFVAPRLVVALGASAVHALEGKRLAISRSRGPHRFAELQHPGYITVHPSYLLRIPSEGDRKREYRAFLRDLQRARKLAADSVH